MSEERRPEDGWLRLSKLDLAERQLAEAIWMYFHDRDPIASYTTAAAGYQIVIDLAKAEGIKDPISEILDSLPIDDATKREVWQAIRIVQNSMKHAEKDPDGILEFNPNSTPFLLFFACQLHLRLTSKPIPEFAPIVLHVAGVVPEAFGPFATVLNELASRLGGRDKKTLRTFWEVKDLLS